MAEATGAVDPGQWDVVDWADVAGIERETNAIVVDAVDEPGALRFEQFPDVEEAYRYLQHRRSERA